MLFGLKIWVARNLIFNELVIVEKKLSFNFKALRVAFIEDDGTKNQDCHNFFFEALNYLLPNSYPF